VPAPQFRIASDSGARSGRALPVVERVAAAANPGKHSMSIEPLWNSATSPGSPSGFLADLLDCVAEGILAADLEGRFVLFNASAQRLLGLGPRDVPRDRWSEAYGVFLEDTVTPFPPDQLPLARAIRGDTVQDCVVYIRNPKVPDGRWINVSGTPLRDKDGVLYGGVAVFREVTDERRTLERTRLLSTVAEQTADAVIITDRQGVIEYVNPAVQKMTGFAPDELIGKTPRVLRSGLHTKGDYARMWDTLTKGEVFRGTLINRKKADGAIYYSEQTITPIRDSAGKVSRFVSVAKDLTAVRASLERSSKLGLARSVQQRMYPDSPPETCGFDIAGMAIPADETGGDYYDYLHLPHGGLALAVGDVSGHGFDAALHMVQARTLMRALVLTQSDPGVILGQLNGLLLDELDAHRFMTLVLACLQPGDGTMRYASAGHTTGYLIGREGRVKAELPSTGIPLGLIAGSAFGTIAVPGLEEGDILTLFTDGLIESIEDGASYGHASAIEEVRRHRHDTAAAIVRRVCEASRSFAPGPQDDDLTMVVCKVSGRPGDSGPAAA
jgi:PAS domain S-box-containing protein